MNNFRKTEWFGQPVIEIPTYGSVLVELSEDDLKGMLKALQGNSVPDSYGTFTNINKQQGKKV